MFFVLGDGFQAAFVCTLRQPENEIHDGAATARRQMCIQWTLLVGKMSASRRRAIGYRFGKGFRLPFAVQSKGSLKTNECDIIMNAGANIDSLKCLPALPTACWQAVRWQKR